MTVYWYDHAADALRVCASTALCIAVSRKKSSLKVPWLAGFAVLFLFHTLVCTGLQDWLSQFRRMSEHRTVYTWWFYTYWLGKAALALVGFGVLYETVMALPLARRAPKNLKITFGTFALIVTAGAAYYAHLSGAKTFFWTQLALKLQLCIAVAWTSFGVALVITVLAFGLFWTKRPQRIAIGFLLQSIVYIVAAFGASGQPQLNRNLTLMYDFTVGFVFLFWTYAIIQLDIAPVVRYPNRMQATISLLGLRSRTPEHEAQI